MTTEKAKMMIYTHWICWSIMCTITMRTIKTKVVRNGRTKTTEVTEITKVDCGNRNCRGWRSLK